MLGAVFDRFRGKSEQQPRLSVSDNRFDFECRRLNASDYNRLTLGEREQLATMQLMEELRLSDMRELKGFVHPSVTGQPYNYQPDPMPTDEEGYIQAFEPHQKEEIAEFFERYGVVVVKNILTTDECTRSEEEVWDFMTRHFNKDLKRDDPSTWSRWAPLAKLGILGNDLVLSHQFCENRQNPKLYQAFQAILQSSELWVNTGRASAMRPTRDVGFKDPYGNLTPVDKPEWRTAPEWLHWDQCPWTGRTTAFAWRTVRDAANVGYDKPKVQGFLTLVDCGPNDGGFHCVPGFHRHIRGWANSHIEAFKPSFRPGSLQVPKDDPIRKDIQTVPARKGSLVVWSSSIPHGTFPNNSSHGRMVQYVHMARADDESILPLFSNLHLLPASFDLTALGRKLFGFEPWHEGSRHITAVDIAGSSNKNNTNRNLLSVAVGAVAVGALAAAIYALRHRQQTGASRA